MRIFYLFFFLFISHQITYAQYGRNSQFLIGYQTDPYEKEIGWYNMSYLQFKDTGLYFTQPFYIPYNFNNSQSFTFCDTNGKPKLQLHGCAVIESDSFEIVENGFFAYENLLVSCKLNLTDTNKMIFDFYPNPLGSFILNIGESDDSLYLIYQRLTIETADEKYFGRLFGATAVRYSDGKYKITNKNIDLTPEINYSPSSTQAVRHANGRDWWIIFGDMEIRQNFYAILLDEKGYHQPIKSVINEWKPQDVFDYLVISPDGNQVAVTAPKSDYMLLNFDRCDGQLSYIHHGPVERLDPQPQAQEVFQFVEFSHSGRYLYVNTEFRIVQYDLEATDIDASRAVIAVFDTTGLTHFEKFGGFSNPIRAPNGYLYYWSWNSVPLIHRIEFPDRQGQACHFTQGHTRSPVFISWWTQTFIDYDLGPLPPGSCELSNSKVSDRVSDVQVYPNPTRDQLHLSIPPGLRIQSLDLHSIQGQVVKQLGDYPYRDVPIDIGQLPAGIYFLRVNGQVVCKVVKVG